MEVKQFWGKIWRQKEHDRMTEWINNMDRVARTQTRLCGRHISKIANKNTQ